MTAYDALGFDPAPGDPTRGDQMATTLREVTNALAEINDVVSGTGDQQWQGRTAEEFRDLMGEDFRPRIQDAYHSFAQASRAVDAWVRDLEGFQRRADALEAEAVEARSHAQHAQSLVDGMGDKPTDGPALTTWQETLTGHQSAVTSSQGALTDIVRRAHELADEASTSATTTASLLDTAMKSAPDEPGFWDRVGNALSGALELLGDIASFIKDNWWNLLHQIVSVCATVLSVASLFFPALAPFALAFAIADVLMSGIDWARGVPGAKEAFLAGAVGLLGGAAFGKLAGSFMKVAGPSLATGPFRVMASGGAASIAAPAAAVLSFNSSLGPALGGYLFLRMKDAQDGGEAITSLFGGNTYYSASLADGWRRAREN